MLAVEKYSNSEANYIKVLMKENLDIMKTVYADSKLEQEGVNNSLKMCESSSISTKHYARRHYFHPKT